LGVPVRDSTQHIIGHLVIIDDNRWRATR